MNPTKTCVCKGWHEKNIQADGRMQCDDCKLLLPTKVEKCCPKCLGISRSEGAELRDFYCEKPSCPCHIKPEQQSSWCGEYGKHYCELENCRMDIDYSGWERDWEVYKQRMLALDMEGTKVGDFPRLERDIEAFIRTLLAQARAESYKEGVKDGESTKNGVERYQTGYRDGVTDERQRIAEVVREMVQEPGDPNISGDDGNAEAYGHHSALMAVLAAIAPEVSKDNIK